MEQVYHGWLSKTFKITMDEGFQPTDQFFYLYNLGRQYIHLDGTECFLLSIVTKEYNESFNNNYYYMGELKENKFFRSYTMFVILQF